MWRCNISKFPYFVPCTLFLIILKINTLFSCQNFFNQFLVNWRNVLKLSMLMPQFGPAMRYKDQFHRPILYHIDVVGSWNGFLRVAVSLLTLRLLLANSCPGVSLFGCSSLVFFLSPEFFRVLPICFRLLVFLFYAVDYGSTEENEEKTENQRKIIWFLGFP